MLSHFFVAQPETFSFYHLFLLPFNALLFRLNPTLREADTDGDKAEITLKTSIICVSKTDLSIHVQKAIKNTSMNNTVALSDIQLHCMNTYGSLFRLKPTYANVN